MSLWKPRLLLLALLVVTGSVELRWAWTTLRYIHAPESFPRGLAGDLDPETFKIDRVEDFARKQGLRNGDVLVAIDGVRVVSYADASRRSLGHAPGSIIVCRVRRAGAGPLDIRITVAPESADWRTAVIPLVLNILTPLCCTGLGFLVALRRPRDPVALALLLLLLSLSFMMSANGNFRSVYAPVFTWTIALLNDWASAAWPAAWLAFALLFPDPQSPFRLWPRFGWALAIPALAFALLRGIWVTLLLHGVNLTGWLVVPHWVPSPVLIAWNFTMVSLGFVNCFRKYQREPDPVQRRRLKWAIYGLTLGVLPMSLLMLSEAVLHSDLNTYPMLILAPGILSPLIVPFALAYAVLVYRVFDVGVFVREGLLATWSAVVLTVLVMAVFSWQTYVFVSRRDIADWQRALGVAVALCGVLVVNRCGQWLRGWVDRRFFQEAVDAEHVLTNLTAEVRRITDPQILLRTVSERIASALHVSHVVALVPATGGMATACCFGFAPFDDCRLLSFDDPHLRRLSDRREPLLLNNDDSEPLSDALSQLHAELLLPLGTTDELQGVLGLGAKRSQEPYTKRDIRLLESVANQTALALEVSRLTAAVAEEATQRERINNELEIARQVQQRLFPKSAPAVPGLQLAGRCLPAETIGGDYFDFLTAPSGEIGFAIGDVAGKGVPAALLMAGLQASLRSLTVAGIGDLSDLFAKLNLLVYDATPSNRFATFFYGAYAPSTRRFRYATAGHNPALLYRAAQDSFEWLHAPGIGLGLRRVSSYSEAEVTLAVGDVLVLYTDGVTEARNLDLEEFGEERLLAAVRASAGGSSDEILAQIVANIGAFVTSAPQHDDITLIVARAL